MAISVSSEARIDLLGTVEILHDHLTKSLRQTVFQQTRSTERERQWSLAALASFWTEVILRAPQSLTRALQEAALGNGSPWPHVPASPEEISPAKFFPRMAAASIGLTWSELAFIETQLAQSRYQLAKAGLAPLRLCLDHLCAHSSRATQRATTKTTLL